MCVPARPRLPQEKRRVRLKEGFRPPRSGRRGEAEGDAQRLRCGPAGPCACHSRLRSPCSPERCRRSSGGRIHPTLGRACDAAWGLQEPAPLGARHGIPHLRHLPPAPPCSLWQRVRSMFEPSVPGTTLVNDGSIFLALGIWAGWTAAASDPTLPLGAALAFAAWKLYDKRNKRNPGVGGWVGGEGSDVSAPRCCCE